MKTLTQHLQPIIKNFTGFPELQEEMIKKVSEAVEAWLTEIREGINKSIDYRKKTIAELKLMKIQMIDELLREVTEA